MNKRFRAWTRGVSFNLTMGRRQVYTLVMVHHCQSEHHMSSMMYGQRHPDLRHFVTSMGCLVDRGLCDARVWRLPKVHELAVHSNAKIKSLYKVTAEGELVVQMLKATGVYQEVLADIQQAHEAWAASIARFQANRRA